MSSERTERATPRKRQKAAEKGDRVRSRELVAAAGMIAGVLSLGGVLESWGSRWSSAYQAFLALGATGAWQDIGSIGGSMGRFMTLPLAG